MATQTSIAREAPFMEDYRRRMLDAVWGGQWTEEDKAAGLIPSGQDVGDKRPGLADDPLKQYQRGIAGFAPHEAGAFSLAAQQMGVDPTTGQITGVAGYQPFMDLAKQGITQAQTDLQQAKATGALGLPSLSAAQQQYDPTTANTADFMNQYQADVTTEAMKQMDEQAAKARQNLAGQAQQAGAFGGSRFGVQEAELDKNLQDIKSRRVFEDLSRNFLQAQQQAISTGEAARGRNLGAAQVYNQLRGTGIQGAQAGMGMGLGMGNLGAQQAQLGAQGVSQLLGTGQVGRTREQAQMDELFRYQTGAANEPRLRLQYGADILAGQPSQYSTFGQQSIPYTNPLMSAAGMGIAGLGAYKGMTD